MVSYQKTVYAECIKQVCQTRFYKENMQAVQSIFVLQIMHQIYPVSKIKTVFIF